MRIPLGCWHRPNRSLWERAVGRYRTLVLSGSQHRVQLPIPRHSLQLVATAISELKTGACDQVSHRTRHEDLARRGRCHYSSTNVYGHPAQLTARHLTFTGVDTCSDSKAEPGSAINDRGRAVYRPRRPIEMGQKAVACAVDLATTMEIQLTADKRVV